jgi:uncharacterized protein YjbI with pentapeptide repeats
MANEEQLAILKQGVKAWNKWREANPYDEVDLSRADLSQVDLRTANLNSANLVEANLYNAFIAEANLSQADLTHANLEQADLFSANLNLAVLVGADLRSAELAQVNLRGADLLGASLTDAVLAGSQFSGTYAGLTIFGSCDLSRTIGLEYVHHRAASTIGSDTFVRSKGNIPEAFLRGCGLSDWEIEAVKLYDPDLTNDERNGILYRIYDLQATQALQISPLFISYSRADDQFVDKMGDALTKKGIRYWRDIHNMKSGRMEKQIDSAIRQNPTVLLVLSQHSLESDWVEHEVRTARGLEKELARDVLCPVALDDSWKSSRWPKRLMEQITEYNILDFSVWKDDGKFDAIFRKLTDGLELFYKG